MPDSWQSAKQLAIGQTIGITSWIARLAEAAVSKSAYSYLIFTLVRYLTRLWHATC
jgi:hypothetical protein